MDLITYCNLSPQKAQTSNNPFFPIEEAVDTSNLTKNIHHNGIQRAMHCCTESNISKNEQDYIGQNIAPEIPLPSLSLQSKRISVTNPVSTLSKAIVCVHDEKSSNGNFDNVTNKNNGESGDFSGLLHEAKEVAKDNRSKTIGLTYAPKVLSSNSFSSGNDNSCDRSKESGISGSLMFTTNGVGSQTNSEQSSSAPRYNKATTTIPAYSPQPRTFVKIQNGVVVQSSESTEMPFPANSTPAPIATSPNSNNPSTVVSTTEVSQELPKSTSTVDTREAQIQRILEIIAREKEEAAKNQPQIPAEPKKKKKKKSTKAQPIEPNPVPTGNSITTQGMVNMSTNVPNLSSEARGRLQMPQIPSLPQHQGVIQQSLPFMHTHKSYHINQNAGVNGAIMSSPPQMVSHQTRPPMSNQMTGYQHQIRPPLFSNNFHSPNSHQPDLVANSIVNVNQHSSLPLQNGAFVNNQSYPSMKQNIFNNERFHQNGLQDQHQDLVHVDGTNSNAIFIKQNKVILTNEALCPPKLANSQLNV